MFNIAQSAHRRASIILAAIQNSAGFVPVQIQEAQAAMRRFSCANARSDVLKPKYESKFSGNPEFLAAYAENRKMHDQYVRVHIQTIIEFLKSEAFFEVSNRLERDELERIDKQVKQMKAL